MEAIVPIYFSILSQLGSSFKEKHILDPVNTVFRHLEEQCYPRMVSVCKYGQIMEVYPHTLIIFFLGFSGLA